MRYPGRGYQSPWASAHEGGDSHDDPHHQRSKCNLRCPGRHAAALGLARRARDDRNQIRLRHRGCGACTVHIDGNPVRSCLLPVRSIGNKVVTTIEGIGATPAGAKVQKAWLGAQLRTIEATPERFWDSVEHTRSPCPNAAIRHMQHPDLNMREHDE